MSAAQARRRAELLNGLRVLIRRCRIKAALKTSRDNGIELPVSRFAEGVLDERPSALACCSVDIKRFRDQSSSRTTLSTFLLEK